jgi:hypothetical protein
MALWTCRTARQRSIRRAPSDDEGLANKGLAGLPGEHLLLDRLIEVDQSKAGRGVNVAGFTQHSDRGRNLLTRQGIKRMRRIGARAV